MIGSTLPSLESRSLQTITNVLPNNDMVPSTQIETLKTKFDIRSLQDENSSASGKQLSTEGAKQQNLNSFVILQIQTNAPET